MAKCHEDGLCFTTVNNIAQQQAILVNLNSVSAKGFYATAWWMEAKEKYLHIAKIGPNQAYPIYKIIKLSKYASNPQSYLNLIYSKNDIESLKLYTDEHDSKGDLIVKKIDARDFNSYLHRKINNGLEITQDHYQQLNKIADQILVASSEKSREGAGE